MRTLAGYEQEMARLKAEEAELQDAVEAQMFRALGMITHSWAGLEITLDLVNWAIAYHQAEKEPFPVSLNRKIHFFRSAHNKDPMLLSLQANALEIADDITAASKLRHDLIHGYVRDGMHQPVLRVYKHHVPRGEDSHNMYTDEVEVSREALFKLGRTISALVDRLVSHADVLVPTLVQAHRDKAAG